MKPAHLSYSPIDGDGPLSLDDARRAVGLFDDESMNEHLEAIMKSATEYVRYWYGGPLGDEAVTAFYRAFARRMELPGLAPRKSVPGFITESNERIQYVVEGNAIRTAAQTQYTVDASGRSLVVRPTQELLDVRLTDNLDNPVLISFSSTGSAPELERIRAAIRVVVVAMYGRDEGDIVIPRRAVADLLGRNVGVWADTRTETQADRYGTDYFYPKG